MKRFKEASRAVTSLKSEILDQSMSQQLEHYLNMKESDLENSKLVLKMGHVNKINSVYQSEISSYTGVLEKSMEIVQQNYLLLRSLGELDNGMLEKLNQLEKLLQCQRSVKFADDEPTLTGASLHTEPSDSTAIQNIMNLTDFGSDEQASPVSTKKRTNDDDAEEKDTKKSKNSETMDFPFLRPKAVQSINFDSVPSPIENHDLNVTFDLKASKVLSEKTNKATASTTAKQPKPIAAVPKYALNINKENKKYSPGSNRVKKLTRTPVRVAGSKGQYTKKVI